MDETHFDAVIVGSGFGGSVMACRLAEAGLRICLLERGKAYPPGSFPRSPYHMWDNFWDPSEGLYGLFHFWTFRHLSALVARPSFSEILLAPTQAAVVPKSCRRQGTEYKRWRKEARL